MLLRKKKIEIKSINFSVTNPDGMEIEELRFILQQAERVLDESVKSFEYSANKTMTLLATTLTLLIGLSSYLFTEFYKLKEIDILLSSISFSILYLYYIVYILSKNLKAVNVQVSGTKPDILVNTVFYKKEVPSTEKEMYYSVIEAYANRIESNDNLNNERVFRNDLSIKLLTFLPLIFFIFLILFTTLVIRWNI